jgi:hypothetical protein
MSGQWPFHEEKEMIILKAMVTGTTLEEVVCVLLILAKT